MNLLEHLRETFTSRRHLQEVERQWRSEMAERRRTHRFTLALAAGAAGLLALEIWQFGSPFSLTLHAAGAWGLAFVLGVTLSLMLLAGGAALPSDESLLLLQHADSELFPRLVGRLRTEPQTLMLHQGRYLLAPLDLEKSRARLQGLLAQGVHQTLSDWSETLALPSWLAEHLLEISCCPPPGLAPGDIEVLGTLGAGGVITSEPIREIAVNF